MKQRLSLLGAGVVVGSVVVGGCGDPLLSASFTSEIVQLDTCRRVGDADEGCARSEQIAERELELVEVEPDVLWLYGVVREGVADRAILGTRDVAGDFVFIDERTQTDASTGCVVVTRIELRLGVEEGRDADVGVDPCVALVGRSVDTISSSLACDSTNVPAQPTVQTIRRRYQPLDPTSTCGDR